MILTLARKELRELLPLVFLALAAQLVVAGGAMNVNLGIAGQRSTIPFVDSNGSESIWGVFFVGGVFAVAAGLRQTMWESARGTFLLLLHRPVKRETVFYIKLAVGAAATMLVYVLPLAIYALWAATPGTHASPFFWSMTTWVWQMSFEMMPLYFAAFVSGLSSGRWYGSQFLPLAASAALAKIVAVTIGMSFGWQLVSVGIAAAVSVTCVAAAIYVARSRDFS